MDRKELNSVLSSISLKRNSDPSKEQAKSSENIQTSPRSLSPNPSSNDDPNSQVKRTRFKTIIVQNPINIEKSLSVSPKGPSPMVSPRDGIYEDLSSSLPPLPTLKKVQSHSPAKWKSTIIHKALPELPSIDGDLSPDEGDVLGPEPVSKKGDIFSRLKDLPSNNNLPSLPKINTCPPKYKANVEKATVVEPDKSTRGSASIFGSKSHVEYTIRVARGEESWNVKRRYNDFLHFHQKLSHAISDPKSLPHLTGKMVFGNFKEESIQKRKEKLNRYIHELLEVPDLPHKLLDDFLMQDQQVRIDSFKDIALQAFKSLGGCDGKIPVENLNKIKDLAPKINLDEIFNKTKELSFEEFYQILDHQEEKVEEIEEMDFSLSNVVEIEKFKISGIFGASLDDLIKTRKLEIVMNILRFLADKDVDFDQKCNEVVILRYQHMINSGQIKLEECNCIVLGIMMKRFLLSLPQCLLNTSYFLQFMTRTVQERDIPAIQATIQDLPKTKRDFIILLIAFFKKIIFENNISLTEISFLFAHVFIRDTVIRTDPSQWFVEKLLTIQFNNADEEDDWNVTFSPLYAHAKQRPKIKIDYRPETPWVYYKPCHQSKDLSTITKTLSEYLPYVVEENDDVIVYEKKDCKAITVEKLLFKLTEDTKFHKSFLLTYRSLMSGCDLMKKLMFLYDLPPSGNESFSLFLSITLLPLRLKIAQFLSLWICHFFADFREEPKLRLLLDEFCLIMSATKLDEIAQSLRKQLGSHMKKRATFLSQQVKDIVSQTVYKSLMSASPPETSEVQRKESIIVQKTIAIVDVLKFKSHDVANQLTLMTFQNFNNIRSKEFLNSAWTKEDKETNSPNILHMIKTSNMISHWVATEIVTTSVLRDRVMKIMKFIKIAVYCRNLNNYNNIMDIYAGLNVTAVYRLKKTWALVPANAMTEWKTLEALVDPSGSFRLLRQEQYKKSPCIPYIGMYLTDLMFIEDGNKDYLKSGLLNWAKRNLQAKLIDEIQTYQKSVYRIENELEIMKRLYGLVVLDPRELDKASLEAEPREKV